MGAQASQKKKQKPLEAMGFCGHGLEALSRIRHPIGLPPGDEALHVSREV